MFAKGLVHGFGLKLAIFPSSILDNISQENVFYDICKGQNAFLCYINKKLKKVEKLRSLQRVSPWFWSKIGHLSIFFILGNIG